MKIKNKVTLGFLAVILLSVAVAVISIYELTEIAKPLKGGIFKSAKTVAETEHLNNLADSIRYYDEVLTQSARNYSFTQDKKWKERYKKAEPELEAVIKEVIDLGDEKDKTLFRSVDAANRALVEMENRSIELVDKGKPQEAVKVLESREYWSEKEVYEKGLGDYLGRKELTRREAVEGARKTLDLAIKSADKIKKFGVGFIVIFTGVAFIIAVGISVVISRSITSSIAKLMKTAEKVGKGDLDAKAPVDSKDEIADLSRQFNKMTENFKISTSSLDKLSKEIAERSRMAQALRISEDKYRTLFELSGDAIMTVDPEKGFLSGNPATIKMFECKDEREFISKTPWEFSPEYQPDGRLSNIKARDMMEIALEKGSNFFEWKHKRLKGEEFFATVLLTRIELGGKKILQATVRDITNEKRLQERIAQGAKEWESTFNSISDLISVHDKDFRVVRVNKAFAEAFGVKPEEVIGKHCYEIVHGTKSPWVTCPQKKALGTKEAVVEEFFEPRVGKYIEVSAWPILDKKGEINGIIHVIKDITQRKQVETKLAEAMETKSQFISMVSHELRTPLTGIKEGISIVLDGSAGEVNKDQKEFLDLAKRNVDRLSRLINDVLDYQKLEAGKMVFSLKENDVNLLVDEVIRIMSPVAKSKNLYIEAHIAEGLPNAIFDKDKITQVLINLVNNAIKFTDAGGIVISASQEGESILFSVKDTGLGIKKEDISKLFKGFSQLEAGRERKKGSTGLGLAISQKIVKEHKGEIWVESEPGKGSDFKFRMPIKAKYKVMVIDDSKEILDTCRDFLTKEGYNIVCFERGLDAIKTVGKDRPDIVLLDMRLKDINGYEIIGRLRSNSDTSALPILVMSGYPEELIKIEDKREDSALTSIGKPFDLKDLLVKMRILLKQAA